MSLLGVVRRVRGQERCRVRRRGTRPVGDGSLHWAARRHGDSGRAPRCRRRSAARDDPMPVLDAGMGSWDGVEHCGARD